MPFQRVGQTLWLRASATTVRLYAEHELVATHPRPFRAAQRSTVTDHMPPEALAHQLRDPQWCRRQAEAMGLSTTFVDGIEQTSESNNHRSAA